MKEDRTKSPNAAALRSIQQTIRKCELRKIVPLADTAIYQMEHRGEFPKRFNLSPRCVVWSLVELEEWIEQRRQGSIISNAKARVLETPCTSGAIVTRMSRDREAGSVERPRDRAWPARGAWPPQRKGRKMKE